jgi:lysine-N-methylase
MLYTIPDYYKEFVCTSDRCEDTCCAGWQIVIDERSLKKYGRVQGTFKRQLRKSINWKEQVFRQSKDKRCAFLNENNLCEIILNLGEDALCQICSDHPRFRNFYDNEMEIGLGLCCEEAGRIILSQQEEFKLNVLDEDANKKVENDFFKYKQNILNKLQNKEQALEERILCLLQETNIELPKKDFSQWIDFYLSLERLDDNWTNLLIDMKTSVFKNIDIPKKHMQALEKLLLYFIYRHVIDEDNEVVKFSIFSVYFISMILKYHISKYGELSLEDIIEYSRMYSSEIEYSDENVEKIIAQL